MWYLEASYAACCKHGSENDQQRPVSEEVDYEMLLIIVYFRVKYFECHLESKFDCICAGDDEGQDDIF